MIESQVDISAPVEAVFATLVDVSTYPDWLVGAKKIRAVDDGWPAVGSSFHHTIGVGPIALRDRTTVRQIEEPCLLVLEARIGPLGGAMVRFDVTEVDDISRVTFGEVPKDGLVRRIWMSLARPLVGGSIWGRNAVSLQKLATAVTERAT